MASAAEPLAANLDLGAFAGAEELKKRIWFTLGALVVYRIGVHIPLPGVHKGSMEHLFGLDELWQAHAFQGISLLTGGGFAHDSVFALGILSLIISDILFAILSPFFPSLEALFKEGEQGRKQLNQYKRYLFVRVALAQAIIVLHGLEGSNRLYDAPSWSFRVTAIATLVTGAVFLLWLSEQITARGIGNGSRVLIVAGLIAALPDALAFRLSLSFTSPSALALAVLAVFLALSLVLLRTRSIVRSGRDELYIGGYAIPLIGAPVRGSHQESRT